MTEISNPVVIRHPGLKREAVVGADSVGHWKAVGWELADSEAEAQARVAEAEAALARVREAAGIGEDKDKAPVKAATKVTTKNSGEKG